MMKYPVKRLEKGFCFLDEAGNETGLFETEKEAIAAYKGYCDSLANEPDFLMGEEMGDDW